jgi:hypothetical protein
VARTRSGRHPRCFGPILRQNGMLTCYLKGRGRSQKRRGSCSALDRNGSIRGNPARE